MTPNEMIVPGFDATRPEGFSVRLETVADEGDCVVFNLEGYYLHEGGEKLVAMVGRCLRKGFRIFLFRLELGHFSAEEFVPVWKKLALNDARMAFVGLEWRHKETFRASGLDSLFIFAASLPVAIDLCRAAPSQENAKLRLAIDSALGPDPAGLRLGFLRLSEGLVIHVSGKLDASTIGLFEAKARKALELGNPRLVFDLGAVECRGGEGLLPALEGIVRTALKGGGNVALARLSPDSKKFLDGPDMARFLRVFETIEEALAFVQDGGVKRG